MGAEGATMAQDASKATFRVRIPGVPDSCLLPNAQRRLSHHEWGPAAKALRETTRWVARDALNPPAFLTVCPVFRGDVRIRAVIAWPGRRRACDFQAAVHALKPLVDGLEDAGVFANDRQVVGMDVTQVRAERGDRAGWVEITVEGA